jgi:hypothetical protein
MRWKRRIQPLCPTGVPRQLGVPVKSRKADILLPAHIGALVWLVSGFVLCAAETMTLGALLIWVGLAASTDGAIAHFVTVDLTSQLLLFGTIANQTRSLRAAFDGFEVTFSDPTQKGRDWERRASFSFAERIAQSISVS